MRLPKSAEACPEFALWLVGQDRTLDCIRGYMGVIRLWCRWCEENGIDPIQASQRDVARWLIGRRELEASTVRNNIVTLRSYYNWTIATGLRSETPMRAIKAPRVRLKPVQPYKREELERLLAAAPSRRDRALLLLLLGSGLRSAEVMGIKEEDIDWATGTIRVLGKGRKWREVAPGGVVMRTLRGYLEHRPASIWYDAMPMSTTHGLRSWFRRLSERAGVPNAILHRFRHTFSCLFLEAGGSEGELQKILGHSTLDMTFRYAESVRGKLALDAQRRFNPADRLLASLPGPGSKEEEDRELPRIARQPIAPAGVPAGGDGTLRRVRQDGHSGSQRHGGGLRLLREP